MSSTRTRSVLLSVVLCLAPAVALILSPAAEAAKKEKPKPVAAKKKAAPSPSASKKPKTADTAVVASPSSAASPAWEAPPRGELTETPPPPAAETKPAPEPVAAAAPVATPPAAPPAAPPAEIPAAPSPPQPSAPPPPEEESMPALVPPPPAQYVEHLGPSSYPGRLRGLYGGSLWLEPSFHGLQWPYMTRTGVGVSGSAWVDTGYEKITSESPNVMGTTRYLQQARAVLRVTPTYVNGRFFIQAQAELVANGCQSTGSSTCDVGGAGTVDTDDLWVRIGEWNRWDLKVGRFEGWELYHTGMGLDVNTLERRGATLDNALAPDYYGVNFMHDRPKSAGTGYVALHGYPSDILRIELLGELGTSNIASAGDNFLGGRPSAILDLGWVKLKAGYEYLRETSGGQEQIAGVKTTWPNKLTKSGFGGAVQFVLDPYVEFGANVGRGSQVFINTQGSPDDTQNFTWTSVGGFANLRVASLFHAGRPGALEDLLLGGGFNWTTRYDSHRAGTNDPDYAAHLQIFGAVQYLIAKQLFVKAVLAYARADFDPSGATADEIFSNTMLSARVRLMYLY